MVIVASVDMTEEVTTFVTKQSMLVVEVSPSRVVRAETPRVHDAYDDAIFVSTGLQEVYYIHSFPS